MKHYILLLLFSFYLSACVTRDTELPLQFENKVLVKSVNNCLPDSADCTYIKYAYPEFKGNHALSDTLNNFIKHTLGASNKLTLEQTQNQFINDYIQFKKLSPESKQVWYSNSTLSVKHQNQSVVCIAYDMNDYAGGAHGMHAITYSNYWQKKATPIGLNELFTDNNLKALKVLAENEFRTQHNLSTQADLDSAGYWFKDNVFALNDNFSITAEGITWVFNPYEIAPYAAGIVEISLPKDDFMPLLKEEMASIWSDEKE